jgi:hypothetical protein
MITSSSVSPSRDNRALSHQVVRCKPLLVGDKGIPWEFFKQGLETILVNAPVVDVTQSKTKEKEEPSVVATPRGMIATLKHRTQRTTQESLVASLLLELGYRH